MSWKTYQEAHSFLDASASSSKIASLHLSFKAIIVGLLSVSTGRLFASSIKSKRPDIVIMGHMVYRCRACIAHIRQSKKIIAIQLVGQYLYKIPEGNDLYVCEKHIRKYLSKYFAGDTVLLRNALHYWNSRLSTGGTNPDLAKLIQKNPQSHYIDPDIPLSPNYIFLHVFRDSPFHSIDKNRIFVDYVDWIKSTLAIIQSSSSQWTIKVHPSASLWGEDQNLIIKSIMASTYGLDNVMIDYRDIPSINYMKNLDKVVTYNGTAALEAIAFNLKPIVIQRGPWSDFLPDQCYLPRSIADYKQLLLQESTTFSKQVSDNDPSKTDIAKLILYIREVSTRLEQVKNPEWRGLRTAKSASNIIIHNDKIIKNMSSQKLKENLL
jgi:hypothetical protein